MHEPPRNKRDGDRANVSRYPPQRHQSGNEKNSKGGQSDDAAFGKGRLQHARSVHLQQRTWLLEVAQALANDRRQVPLMVCQRAVVGSIGEAVDLMLIRLVLNRCHREQHQRCDDQDGDDVAARKATLTNGRNKERGGESKYGPAGLGGQKTKGPNDDDSIELRVAETQP